MHHSLNIELLFDLRDSSQAHFEGLSAEDALQESCKHRLLLKLDYASVVIRNLNGKFLVPFVALVAMVEL